jgi:hypothetical protein
LFLDTNENLGLTGLAVYVFDLNGLKFIRSLMHKLILMAFMFLYLPAFSYAQPAIHFNEVRHDFGKISQDDKIEYIFEFSNTGNQPLIIEKISPS